MINLQEILFNYNKSLYDTVETEALCQLKRLHNSQRVRDDVFEIIRHLDNTHLIIFPIKDDDLCGFNVLKRKRFIFINSYLPLEKQIFTAAHELYHILYDKGDSSSCPELLFDYEDYYTGNENEMAANTFAACFLVPKQHLDDEISLLKIDKKGIEVLDVIKLMDEFAVPYKAMILRLYETGYIEKIKAEKFLSIEDRQPNQGIMFLINKTRHAKRWQTRTETKEYSDFFDKATKVFEEQMVTFDKIKSDFMSLNENIEDYLSTESEDRR